MTTIEAEPHNAVSWNYHLRGDDHQAYWEKKKTSEQCLVHIDGVLYSIRKHGPASGFWTLEQEGEQVASAKKLSAFKRSFEIQSTENTFQLMSVSAFSRSFFVGKGDEIVATISPKRFFSYKARIEIEEEDFDFRIAVLAFWLVVISWRREEGA